MYHIQAGGNKQGPFSLDEIRQQLTSGTIPPDALCSEDDGKTWNPISSLDATTPSAPALSRKPVIGIIVMLALGIFLTLSSLGNIQNPIHERDLSLIWLPRSDITDMLPSIVELLGGVAFVIGALLAWKGNRRGNHIVRLTSKALLLWIGIFGLAIPLMLSLIGSFPFIPFSTMVGSLLGQALVAASIPALGLYLFRKSAYP